MMNKYKIKEFFCRSFLIKRSFNHQGFIHLDYSGNITKSITSRIKWLQEVDIVDYSEKKSIKKAIERLEELYPECKGYIKLF